MDPRNFGARSPADGVFKARWRTSLHQALLKRLAGAERSEAGPGQSFGLFGPLVPGATEGGSGGQLGDAVEFALGAAVAGGWALAAAWPVGYALDAGAAAFGW